MSSRDDILRAVRAARPKEVPLPDLGSRLSALGTRHSALGTRHSAESFADAVRASGARVVEGARRDAARLVAEAYPDARRIASAAPAVAATMSAVTAHDFADADLFVCEAALGVAENGAVWLTASRLGPHRAALFLATSVVVLLDRATVVATMHEAYARLDIAAESFGIFVAGPSKTADIEQSLVIGAHGPKALTVVLLDEA